MKNKLFNEDGTIKKSNMIVFILIVFVIAFFLIYILLFKEKDITKDAVSVSNTTKTSQIKKLCDGCTINFKGDQLVFEANKEYFVEDLVDLKKVNLRNINFSVEDQSLGTFYVNKENEFVFKTLDKVGTTKIKAKYQSVEDSAIIVVDPGVINSASFIDHPYYIYLNEEDDIKLNTSPEGISISNFNITFDNPEIAYINDNGKIVGTNIGSTTMRFIFNDEEFSQEVNVLSSRLDIYCKVGDTVNDCYNIDYKKIKNDNFNITIKYSDKYTYDDLSYKFVDNGIFGNVSYDGKNPGEVNSYNFRINITKVLEESNGYVEFSLPDGTKKSLNINNMD